MATSTTPTAKEQANSGTAIYGRRMFETMAVWDSLAEDPSVSQAERDFGTLWRHTDKLVVSRSLPEVKTTQNGVTYVRYAVRR